MGFILIYFVQKYHLFISMIELKKKKTTPHIAQVVPLSV